MKIQSIVIFEIDKKERIVVSTIKSTFPKNIVSKSGYRSFTKIDLLEFCKERLKIIPSINDILVKVSTANGTYYFTARDLGGEN